MNLVQKLRLYAGVKGDKVTAEAADEIERLRAKVADLRQQIPWGRDIDDDDVSLCPHGDWS